MLKNILRSSLFKQFSGFGIGPIVGMFISTLTVPITTRFLLPEEYGKSALFTLAKTIFVLVAFLGLDQSFIRFYNQKDISKKTILCTSFTVPFLVSIFLGFCSIILMRPISIWLYGSFEPFLMILFPLFLISIVFDRFSISIIRMQLRGRLFSIISIFTQLISFIVLLFLLIYYEKTFRSIVLAAMFSSYLSTIVLLFITRNEWAFKKEYFDKNLFKSMIQFSLPLIPATLLSWLLNSFDKIAIKQWSSYQELGFYAAAFKIVTLVSIFQTIFTTGWVPVAYKWYEESKEKKYFESVSTIVTICMTFIYMVVVLFRDLLFLFLGAAYRDTTQVFIFLLFMPVMYTISEASAIGIGLKKKTKYSLIISIIAVVINIVLNFLLVPKYGAKGAAIGTCVSYLAFYWGRIIFARKAWYKFPILVNIVNCIGMVILLLFVYISIPKLYEIFVLLIMLIINVPFLLKIKNTIIRTQ